MRPEISTARRLAAALSLAGTVFKLTPNAERKLDGERAASLQGQATDFPSAGLIFDAAGNLYGTTPEGGAYDYGVVFKLAPNSNGGWNETLLHTFTGGKDGGVLVAGVIFDQAGNLYGTTRNEDRSLCGGQGCGVVFKLTPNSNGGWKDTVVHTFQGKPGANPLAGLIFDAAGNLYGTTSGRFKGFGSVFEITP